MTPEMSQDRVPIEDAEAVRDEWLKTLNALAAQVKGWVERAGWRTRLVSKPTRDAELGRFEVPLLLMERDGVEIALNPVSRFVHGAEGAVDLYVVPAYDEVGSLYYADGRWMLYYVFRDESAAKVRKATALPLSEGHFIWIIDEMAKYTVQEV